MSAPQSPGALLQAMRKNRRGGGGKGRTPLLNRCPCGAMTAARAAKRGHKCQAKNS